MQIRILFFEIKKECGQKERVTKCARVKNQAGNDDLGENRKGLKKYIDAQRVFL